MKYAYTVCILLVLLVLSAGCASFVPNLVPTPAPTKAPTVTKTVKPPTVKQLSNSTTVNNTTVATTVPTTEVTTATPTPIPTLILTATPTGYYLIPPETTWTEQPSETPLSTVAESWRLYQNRDFKVERPSGWQVIETVGGEPNPVLYLEGKFKPESRVVIFDSGDGKTNFTIATYDLLVPGYYKLDTTMAWVQRTITPRLFDVSGIGSITNYEVRYTEKGTEFVTFDVIIPATSVYYPYVYTERNVGAWSHVYTARFNSYGNLTDFKEIRDHMFNTLKVQERTYEQNGEFS